MLLILIIYHNLDRPQALTYITATCVFALIIEFTRFHFKKFNKYVQKTLAPFLRTNEMNSFSGLTSMVLGCWLAIILFPKNIVTLALYFLATADPIASYFGLKYGKDRLVANKTLQGSIAAFVVCTVVSFFYYFVNDLMIDRLFIVSLLSGLIGTFAELLAVGRINDNFSIPVFGSLGLWVVFYIFGGFIQ